MIEAYPLQWPEGKQRTKSYHREAARFTTTFARARDDIVKEIGLLVGRYAKDPGIVISTNIPLRRDGLPYAVYRIPEDVGVAVYFTYKGKQVCFCCDRWKKIEHNMQAICKTIEALRGIARWGTGDMLEAAFTGFAALPPPTKGWRADLDLPPDCRDITAVQQAYKRLRSKFHPDHGGNSDDFYRINRAIAAAEKELCGGDA